MRIKPGLIGAFAIATLFIFVVGGTVAYFFASTNNIVNTFVPGEVKCEVQETFSNNVKSSIKVANTGTTSAYMRVCFTTYWVEKYTENNENKTRILGRNAELPSFNLGTDWVKGADGYYYYTKPVPPKTNNLTGELLASGSSINLGVDNDNPNIVQVVEVFAEAIQSAPDDAVLEAWGSENGGSVGSVNNSTLVVNQ